MRLLVFLTVLVLFSGLCGCMEEVDDSTNHDTNGLSEHLTDEDWNYYVFSYTSGKDLHELFDAGFTTINTALAWFDPTNSSFLLEINASNTNNISQLEHISTVMSENISRYTPLLQNYSLSDSIQNHSLEQKKLFLCYQNLSNIFLLISYKVQTSLEHSNQSSILVDISEDMGAIFDEDGYRTDIMNTQVDIMVSIPDETWEEWTKDRDWSFMG